MRQLARRCGTLAQESADDVRALEEIMASLGVQPSRVKSSAALVAERLGRLKANGHLHHRSPLSTLVELDYLAVGLHAKLLLWENLRLHADVDRLVARTDAQLAELEPLRAAARTVLS